MTASNAQGQALLAGLVGFMRPFIDAYATATDSRAKHVCSGAQGKELLSALGRFVTDIIALDEDDTVEDMAKLVILRDREIAPAKQHVVISKRQYTPAFRSMLVLKLQRSNRERNATGENR
ncbi:hypothetical protein HYPSUDRAFT_59972 [Hypholoma sublateritium FD-334 SS-4]|uniref:Uncharacterized protein n=1 Tax=Hypholoma sublateritium (strain FD-334 SS-4) TaxID=945553 RepID=A0A0D2N252_HYPSF|nr:hypothetical protein HYPSUDRAFT_59972 [Hypholoma sublateritium FD-334 SS-4]